MRLGSATFRCFLGIDSCHPIKRRRPCRFTHERIGSVLLGIGRIRFVGRIGSSLCRQTIGESGVGCCLRWSAGGRAICRLWIYGFVYLSTVDQFCHL